MAGVYRQEGLKTETKFWCEGTLEGNKRPVLLYSLIHLVVYACIAAVWHCGQRRCRR